MGDADKNTLHIKSLSNPDHRKLFTVSEVETALLSTLSCEEARKMANEIMAGPYWTCARRYPVGTRLWIGGKREARDSNPNNSAILKLKSRPDNYEAAVLGMMV